MSNDQCMKNLLATGLILWTVPFAAPSIDGPDGAGSGTSLRGPSAAEPTGRRSIVQQDFNGRLEPIEGEIEVAALRALDLDEAQRDHLDAIVSRRIDAFDALVQRHALELQRGVAALQRMESLSSAADRWEALHEISKAWEAFAPWRARGSAIDEMGDLITGAQRREAQRIAAAYRAALTAERARDLGLQPDSPRVRAHVRLEIFGRLLEQSFMRLARSGEDALEALARALDLSPEQVERARAIFSRLHEMEAAREATPWDRFSAVSEFMRELTPDQRKKAWRFLRAQGG